MQPQTAEEQQGRPAPTPLREAVVAACSEGREREEGYEFPRRRGTGPRYGRHQRETIMARNSLVERLGVDPRLAEYLLELERG